MSRFGRGGSGHRPFAQFMQGRNGADHFSRFLSIAGCAAILLSFVTRSIAKGYLSVIFTWAAFLLLIACYWRMFSRNIPRRRAENDRYLALRWKLQSWVSIQKDCFRQRKDYCFFRCPGCRNMVRVPRGKGRLRITCRQCGYSFERKT